MVWEVDESLSSVSQALVTPECECDRSVEAMAMLPALSPQPALSTEYPLFALLVVSAAQSPPEADCPPKRHAVLQAS